MRFGLFYLPSSLPATRAEGARAISHDHRSRSLTARRSASIPSGSRSITFMRSPGFFRRRRSSARRLLQRTKSMRIGTAVLLLPYHNPLRVAEDYATLDCLSNGRLEFGIGHGFVKWEALTFGIPLDDLRERFKENLDVVLKAWSEPEAQLQRPVLRLPWRASLAAPGAGAVSRCLDGGDHVGGVVRTVGTVWISHDAHTVSE